VLLLYRRCRRWLEKVSGCRHPLSTGRLQNPRRSQPVCGVLRAQGPSTWWVASTLLTAANTSNAPYYMAFRNKILQQTMRSNLANRGITRWKNVKVGLYLVNLWTQKHRVVCFWRGRATVGCSTRLACLSVYLSVCLSVDARAPNSKTRRCRKIREVVNACSARGLVVYNGRTLDLRSRGRWFDCRSVGSIKLLVLRWATVHGQVTISLYDQH